MDEGTLRLGVNLLWLRHGVVGGSERYIVNILEELSNRHDDGLEVVLYTLPGLSDVYPALASSFRIVEAPVRGRFRPLRVFVENTWLARRVKADKIDVMHHAGGSMPRRPGPHPVLTLHDVQYLDFPEFVKPIKRAWLRKVVPRSALAAAAVVTSSSHSKARIVDAIGVDPAKVSVLFHVVAVPPVLQDVDVPEPIGSTKPYVYYPALTHPHKNHLMLLKAVSHVEGVDLVLSGADGAAAHAVSAATADLDMSDRVVHMGFVDESVVEAIYAHALAVVFPSRYEGFGAPVAEAMLRGIPVISSNATSLREVVADGGLLLDPDAVGEWTAAITSLLDPDRHDQLVTAAVARSRVFDPSATVEALVGIWRAAARS